jgi:hypothetical protein
MVVGRGRNGWEKYTDIKILMTDTILSVLRSVYCLIDIAHDLVDAEPVVVSVGLEVFSYLRGGRSVRHGRS